MPDLANMSDDEFADLVASMRAAETDVSCCEVKSARSELPRDIGSTISAFANGSGGLIICGLSEKDGFVPVGGFEVSRIQDALAQWCGERMVPAVHPIIEIRMFEGAPIVTAYIPELRPRDKPCYIASSGRYAGSYIRMGDGDRRLSAYEVDRFMEEHEQPRHDARVVDSATLDDLDPVLVKGVLTRERRVHARSFAALDDETALRKLHVVTADEDGVLRPTLAGLLALGVYPQEFFPRLCVAFTCYPGVTRAEASADGRRFVDMATCVGPIPAMVEDVLAAVGRNMRTGAHVEGAARRDVPDYPMVAVREAVVNALMHRDYSDAALGTAVAVDLFSDRLEVTNLGGLYGSVTVRTLGGDAPASARNQFLASLLEVTPLEEGGFVAENRGSGYRSIELALRDAGMPAPEPHDSPSSFSLVMRRRGSQPRSGRVVCAQRFVEQSRSVMALGDVIVEVVRLRGEASMAELVEESGRSRPTVLKAVRDLVTRGVLTPTEKRNSPRQRYRLV